MNSHQYTLPEKIICAMREVGGAGLVMLPEFADSIHLTSYAKS